MYATHAGKTKELRFGKGCNLDASLFLRTKKESWVKAEALVSMLKLYHLTRKREYYDAFAGRLEFVGKHQRGQ